MQMIGGKMYVFGGVHRAAVVGCNLLMALDMETRQWEQLSGTVQPVANFDCPGPRRFAASWVDDAQGNLMIMFGEADRQGARIGGQPHAGYHGYSYDDLWSWNVHDRKWRRERILGNAPCPRSEMSYTWVNARPPAPFSRLTCVAE